MFSRLETWFNAFFVGYATRISSDLATALVPIALALVTVYIGVYGLAVMRGEAPEPISTFSWKMVKVFAIMSFALPGLYYSGNVITGATGLQDSMATLFVAPAAGRAATAFAALDVANEAANEQLRLLWADAGVTRLDLVLASMLFSAGTVIFLVLGAFIGLLAKLIIVFVLAIGPVAILCLLFKSTARFFDSWLSVLLSAVVLSWFVFFALGMSPFVSERVIAAIREGSAFVGGGGTVNALEASSTYLAVMVLLGIILYQSPSLASSLTGGASIQSGVQMASNTMVAMRAMSGGRSGSSGAGAGSAGGSIKPGGGAAFAAGRGVGAAANAVGTVGNAIASGARAAYQRVAQRGNSST
jgi:type IV secretion system protein VirB6